MQRRTYLRGAGVVAAGSLAGCTGKKGQKAGGQTSTPTSGQETITLRSASILPESHPLARGGAVFRKKVTELTDGVIQWDHYPAGQLASDPSAYIGLLQKESADLIETATAYVESDAPLSTVMDLPGTYVDTMAGAEASWNFCRNFLQPQEWDDLGVELVGTGRTGPYQIISAGKKIDSLKDWDGKVVRVASGALALVVEEMGGSPTQMPSSDVYSALQRGTIDGTINGLYTILTYGWQEVADYSSLNVNLGSGGTLLGMRKGVFDEYSGQVDGLREKILKAGQIASKQSAQNIIAKSQEARKTEMEFFELPDDEVERWHSKADPAVNEWISQRKKNGHPGKKAYNSWTDLVAKADGEFDVSG